MIKNIFVLLILLFSVSIANAEHHRGHALYYLERVEVGLLNVLGNIDAVWNSNGGILPPEDADKLEVIESHVELMQSQVVMVEAALRDCSSNLKEIRRLVNQPKNLFLSPKAMLFSMKQASYTNGKIIYGQTVDNGKFLGGLIRTLSSNWQNLDIVLWHINDAIVEEVYGDDDWVGHEPGFDPVTHLGNSHARANQVEHTEDRHKVLCGG